jgi:hypothetical protein
VTVVGNPLSSYDVVTLRPEANEETGKEPTDEDGKRDGIYDFVSIEGNMCIGAQGHELTTPELGGTGFPFPSTVHPAGSTV